MSPIERKRNHPEDSDSSSDELPSYIEQSNENGAKKPRQADLGNLYLETINRNVLDFDFAKVCSVTLSNVNVYCCLVCGKYFQGRSKSSPAYNHSLLINHHVYINLSTEKVYILPDNYEVTSPNALQSLQDIKNLLRPRYSKGFVIPETARDLNNKPYHVGFVGLNNMLANDYANVVIQALSHVPPIRDFYLNLSHQEDLAQLLARASPLNANFGSLIQKIWSSHLFKAHVSPHEFMQEVSVESKKKFSTITQRSPKKFLVWLLNMLHSQLAKSINSEKKTSKTVWSRNFQGSLKVHTSKVTAKETNRKVEFITDGSSTVNSKFWVLQLDLPTSPVFSEQGKFEERSIYDLLDKYNGQKVTQTSSSEVRKYELLSPLPPYLLFHIDRNIEDEESAIRGNTTVVKFPEELDMSEYVKGHQGSLKYRLLSSIKYELITGDKIDRADDKIKWSIHIRRKQQDWVEMSDLEVETSQSELIFLNNNYLQVWERI